MEAIARSLTFLSNAGEVVIPFFQRPYVWKKDNWEDLFSELSGSAKKHFLGSIILKKIDTLTGDHAQVLVIDGQQRLTTLSVLLRAVFDSLPAEIQANCQDAVNGLLFFKKRQTDSEAYPKITHSRIDRDSFKRVIQTGLTNVELAAVKVEDRTTQNDSKDNRILQCYKYFRNELATKPVEFQRRIIDQLLDPQSKLLVVIDLEKDENEQAIFDTINSAGVRLSSADIIKNALFQRAIEVFKPPRDVEEYYKKYWERVFASDQDAIRYWETPRLTGRLIRDNIEILLHAIAVIKGFFDPDKHTMGELGEVYKENIVRLGADALSGLIEEIAEYAGLYREKLMLPDASAIYSYDEYLNRLTHILDALEISTFHPFILFLLRAHTQDEKTLKGYLIALEKYVVRRVLGHEDSKGYNKICKEFIAKADKVLEKAGEVQDSAVLNGLKDISNKHAAILLFWIELHRRFNDGKQSIKHLKYSYTLEHILPQKWEEYWSNVPVYDISGQPIADPEKAGEERNEKIYWIGNMTLLNSKLNTALRNYEFKRKMDGEGRKKGIKSYDELTITKHDIVLPYEQGDTDWNEIKIVARTKMLSDEVLQIWPS